MRSRVAMVAAERRDLIEAGLNEPLVAGSGYGDCVAALIPDGERAVRADGWKVAPLRVGACLLEGADPALSVADTSQAGGDELPGMQGVARGLTPCGDTAAGSTRSGLRRWLMFMGGNRRLAASAASVGAAGCR